MSCAEIPSLSQTCKHFSLMNLVLLSDINVCGTPVLANIDFNFTIISSADKLFSCAISTKISIVVKSLFFSLIMKTVTTRL